jgi:hypothetical protein
MSTYKNNETKQKTVGDEQQLFESCANGGNGCGLGGEVMTTLME